MVSRWLKNQALSRQLAASAATCCLVANLLLVVVASQSSQSIQDDLLSGPANALANQLASEVGSYIETEDRLSLAIVLRSYTDYRTISGARILSIDGGKEIAASGTPRSTPTAFKSPIMIDGDLIGIVELYLDLNQQSQAREQLLLGLIALSMLLAAAAYTLVLPLANRLANKISEVVEQLENISDDTSRSSNEVQNLRAYMKKLPLELLRAQKSDDESEEHYSNTAVLCITIKNLPRYLDTLNEARLQSYVQTLHSISYAGAGFYGGELSVIRQCSLAIYFSGAHSIGSPVVRAASCAWLLRQGSKLAEEQERLSFSLGIAVGASELGHGNDKDIYPGLYIQSTLDELIELANVNLDALLISPSAAKEIEMTDKIGVDVIEERWMVIGEFSQGHSELLNKQLDLLSQLISSPHKETPQKTFPF